MYLSGSILHRFNRHTSRSSQFNTQQAAGSLHTVSVRGYGSLQRSARSTPSGVLWSTEYYRISYRAYSLGTRANRASQASQLRDRACLLHQPFFPPHSQPHSMEKLHARLNSPSAVPCNNAPASRPCVRLQRLSHLPVTGHALHLLDVRIMT
jgi:hypothetical protein